MKKVFEYPSSDGKTSLHAEMYLPKGQPTAVLQITHGMVEHIGRYQPFAEWLCERGFAVVGHDHLGHGATGRREDWGYFCEDHPAATLVEDMHRLRLRTQQAFPGLPYYMLGHSMGSYLLRAYLTLHGEGLNGAVVMGTGFMAPSTAKAALAVIRVMTAVKGSRYRSKTIEGLVFGKEYQRYDLTGKDTKNSWLTRDEKIVAQYYSDPRTTFKFTLNGYRGLVEAVALSCDAHAAEKMPKKLPVLLISGAEDPVGGFGTGVRQTEFQMKHGGIEDLTLCLLKGQRHEVLNELGREDNYQYIYDWMLSRLPERGAETV